jgi:UrcA family protein
MTKTAFVILGAIVTAMASPAMAQDNSVRTVSYADLDLSSGAGRLQLDRRIQNAVRGVCGQAWPLDLNAVDGVRRCRVETLASVTAQRRSGEVIVASVSLR